MANDKIVTVEGLGRAIDRLLLRLGALESQVETMDGTGGKAHCAQLTANQALMAGQAAWQELDDLRNRIDALEQNIP